MDLRSLNKVWEVKALKRQGEEAARGILEDVAKQVQPIMRKRQWTVKILSEFCPANPSLLGINIGGGTEVKLRLRRSRNDSAFFPYHHILDTMLHELCHIEHGPHNSSFYSLLAEIRQECEELMAEGAMGRGVVGRRVGGGPAEFRSLRQNTGNAAAKRARTGALLPSGPLRVGGDADIMSVLSPIQAAAMAAERRLADDVWCGSLLFSEMKSGPLIEAVARTGSGSGSGSGVSSSGGGEWECMSCTLVNQEELGLVCEACGERRDALNLKVWSCKFCTLDNPTSLHRCLVCDQWRFSHASPFPSPTTS